MDIFSLNELLLVAFVALLVIGPERLPETLRTLGLWIGRLTRSFNSVKAELEKEIGMDEIRRQLHNESVMEEMKRIEREVKNSAPPDLDTRHLSDQESQAIDSTPEPDIAPPPEPDPVLPTASEGEENSIEPPQHADDEPDVPTVVARSEAELEAMHARRARQAARQAKSDNS